MKLSQDAKIDQGFCLNYWKLTYRRKFIRTLWMMPLAFVFLLLPADTLILGIPGFWWMAAVLLSLLLQAVYNYRKWRAETQG